MKKIILASACILALSAGGALAQTQQPAPGASSEGNVGPGATKPMKKNMTTGTGAGSSAKGVKGMSANPSSEGNVGPGTNNNAAKLPEAK
jgi:hypothetical protein